MIPEFHHVGLVVETMSQAERLAIRYCNEEQSLYWEVVPDYDCWCAFSRIKPMVEFVVPSNGSKLAAFIGSGLSVMHHIAFKVPRLSEYQRDTALLHTWLGEKSVRGAQGLFVNFAKPYDGLLVEYVSYRE